VTATGPRRVVRVITRLNIGGPARQALALSRELRPDHDTVLAAGAPRADEGELLDPAVEVTRVPLVRPPRPTTDARAVVALRRLIDEHRPDIVHTHMAKAGTVARIAARTSRPRPRTVHTFHGHVLEGYFSRPVQRAFVAVERALARATDVLVAVSPHVRDDLLELGIGQPEQYRVVPLGFDLTEHKTVTGRSGLLRQRLGLSDDAALAGVVGRLVPIKDHATLLDAISRVPDAHLAVIGDGELRGQLEAQAERLGLTARVHFVGWWTDIPSAMADLDVVVLSSRNEGTPVSLIEASACGRPVVATDVGGVRAVVADGRNGLLVPRDDPSALATAIGTVLGDDALAARLGAAGREAVAPFDLQRLVDDIRRLYDELLQLR
jgi:glycosyltransferase involved in cell wall biosynthesis